MIYYEGKVRKEKKKEEIKKKEERMKKSPAPSRNRTFDLTITMWVFYRCATTAAQVHQTTSYPSVVCIQYFNLELSNQKVFISKCILVFLPSRPNVVYLVFPSYATNISGCSFWKPELLLVLSFVCSRMHLLLFCADFSKILEFAIW